MIHRSLNGEVMNKKSIVIISDNSIVFDALSYNSDYSIQHISSDYKDAISKLKKINLLIVDKVLNNNEIPIYRIEVFINLSSKIVSDQEIALSKPCRLDDLLGIISSNIRNKYLFCAINGDWIYNQRHAKLTSDFKEISFTDKENSIFLELLNSKNFCSNKEFLRNKIWNYHQDSESATLETHLYKLKQKLPMDFLSIHGEKCCLHISPDFI